MNLFNFYISANLIILGCYTLFWLWNRYSLVPTNTQLKAVKVFMLFIVLAPLTFSLMPQSDYTVTTAQIWSAPTTKSLIHPEAPTQMHISPFLNQEIFYSLPSTSGADLLLVLFFIGFLLVSTQFLIDSIKLRKIINHSYIIRKIGRVNIRVTDVIDIPFAYWSPFRSTVFLPSSMIFKPTIMRFAIFHELQHHRQGDTQFAYILAFFKAMFFFNPFVHLWEKQILEIQEYACDEAVVGHNSISAQAYGRCLVEVAQSVLQNRRPLFGTASMAASSSKLQLTRRLTMLFNKPKRNKSFSFFVIILSIVSLSVMAFGSKSMVKDRRIEMEDALHYQTIAQSSSQFPIDINQKVLRQLNQFVGTPDGRTYFKEALSRMENYQNMLEEKAKKYGVPFEILALPIIESGYRNLPQRVKTKNKSAGLWQFIPQTARAFGMHVHKNKYKRKTAKNDSRLDEVKATDSAMHYLSDNHRVFNDWRLSLMSYNQGEHALLRAIAKANTRDPWELIEKGFKGDPNYLSKFMAATLIMKNPHILE